MIDIKYLMGICALLFGGTIWLLKPTLGVSNRNIISLLIGASVLSLAHYATFGEFHVIPKYGSQNYHPGEVYLYYMGSKYFKETGYYDLYACTSVAIQEINKEDPNQPTPHLFSINNLKDKRSFLTPAQLWAQYRPVCHEHFSVQRWDAFKNDLKSLFAIGTYDAWWRYAMFDAGYNSTPIFATLVSPIANALPISHVWKMVGYIDFLLIAIAAFFIYRSFGLYPLLGFLLVFGTNQLSEYYWTGGSFFRHAWFASLTVALCLLKEKKYFWSGALFAYSAGDRIFPVLFFIGSLVPLFYEWSKSKGKKRDAFFLIKGFLISIGILFFLSLLLFGLQPWHDFFADMKVHNGFFWVNHVGLRKTMIYFHGIYPQNFWWEAGRVRFDQWNDHLTAVFNSRKLIYYPLALFMVAGSIYVSRKRPPCLAALLVGGSLLYALLMPAQYYYIYLALFPAVAYGSPSTYHNNIRLFLIFFLMLILIILPMLPPDDILLYIYHSYALGMFFLLQILNGLWEELDSQHD